MFIQATDDSKLSLICLIYTSTITTDSLKQLLTSDFNVILGTVTEGQQVLKTKSSFEAQIYSGS